MTGLRLGLIGYSTRALAEAAAELGFAVSAVDAFCDQDTLDVAECHLAHRWPHDVTACAQKVSCDGWLLGGGMENHGRLVAQLAVRGRVLGPTRAQLVALRSVRFWRELADSVSDLAMPATAASRFDLNDGTHIHKPRRSSGGMYVSDAIDGSQLARGYWQEFIAGRVLGATTVITNSSIDFVGATESLSADQWAGPRPYIYRGSLGPVELEPQHRAALLAMAAQVAERLGYRGYLQADLIEDPRGQLWLLELNPRWTAGMEVLHRCASELALSPLAAHLDAFGIGTARSNKPHGTVPVHFAKAILYAPRDLQVSHEQRSVLQVFRDRQLWGKEAWWNIADVPVVRNPEGLLIKAGQPILTLRVGLNSRDSQWTQTRQTLLAGLGLARMQVMQRVFKST